MPRTRPTASARLPFACVLLCLAVVPSVGAAAAEPGGSLALLPSGPPAAALRALLARGPQPPFAPAEPPLILAANNGPAVPAAPSSRQPLLGRPPAVDDRQEGHVVEVAGGWRRHFIYEDSFASGWFQHDPTIEGRASVRWDRERGALVIEGGPRERRSIRFGYRFVSPFVVKDPVAELTGRIAGTRRDSVALCFADGERLHHPARAFGRERGHGFHLTTSAARRLKGRRLAVCFAADLAPGSSVVLTGFRVKGRVKWDEGLTTARLERAADGRRLYRDTFESPKVFNYARIGNQDALGWERGRLFVRDGEADSAPVTLTQKVLLGTPVRAVALRVRHGASGPATSEFGLSLDGRTVLTRTRAHDAAGLAEVRLDDAARLADTRRVYVHITLPPSAALSNLELAGVPTAAR